MNEEERAQQQLIHHCQMAECRSGSESDVRKNMLNDDETKECSRCYEMEKSNVFTLRNMVNQYYGKHWDRVETTQVDGTVEELNKK